MEQDVVCDDDDGDGDGDCIAYHGHNYCNNDDGDMEAEDVTLTDVAGIQAKLYNQDLSLDASFDAGGNIGRFLKT